MKKHTQKLDAAFKKVGVAIENHFSSTVCQISSAMETRCRHLFEMTFVEVTLAH